MTDDRSLVKKAFRARELAYAPYSRFKVGAALLLSDGRVYTGCNIENAAYSPSVCAERTAFVKAVSDGIRDIRLFAAIAVAGGPEGAAKLGHAWPCGVCRQVMMEFCDPKAFRVIIGREEDDFSVHTLEALLPYGFGPRDLESTTKAGGQAL